MAISYWGKGFTHVYCVLGEGLYFVVQGYNDLSVSELQRTKCSYVSVHAPVVTEGNNKEHI